MYRCIYHYLLQFDGHNDLYCVFNEEKGLAVGDKYTTEHQAGGYTITHTLLIPCCVC